MSRLNDDDKAKIDRIHFDAVLKHRHIEDDKQHYNAIRNEFDEEITRQLGDLKTTKEILLRSAAWEYSSRKASKATRNLVQEILSGQTALSLDQWLDQVIVVGKLRRTTIRFLIDPDRDRILSVRIENEERAAKAFRDTAAAMDILGVLFQEWGSMDAAADAKEIPIVFDFIDDEGDDEPEDEAS